MGDNQTGQNRMNSAYRESELFAKSHYENFPVVSLFIPKELRKHVAVVYRFARQADDFADEGKESVEWRVKRLEFYENDFRDCIEGKYKNDFWEALNNTINIYSLTPQYFFDLLSAFKQDVVKKRYKNFDDVLDYCTRSANPVGRIILELFNVHDDNALEYSDAVCTALQLANFYQDVSVDIEKDRIYIPLDEIEQFGISEKDFQIKNFSPSFYSLIKHQVERTRILFEKGHKLLPLLPKQLRFQIRLTIIGGEEILKKIEKLNFDTLHFRPVISKIDYLKLIVRAL